MKIQLQGVIPSYFLEDDVINSEIFAEQILVDDKQRLLIQAQSGKGKTSLLHFIYGLRDTYKGIITINDDDVKKFSKSQWIDIRQQKLSVTFQDLRLFENLTALENIQLKNQLTGYISEHEIDNYFERLGVSECKDKEVTILSQGQKQRIALIRAMCMPFECLLLDEPFSHLDSKNISIIVDLINEELEKRNASLILFSLMEDYGLNCTNKYLL